MSVGYFCPSSRRRDLRPDLAGVRVEGPLGGRRTIAARMSLCSSAARMRRPGWSATGSTLSPVKLTLASRALLVDDAPHTVDQAHDGVVVEGQLGLQVRALLTAGEGPPGAREEAAVAAGVHRRRDAALHIRGDLRLLGAEPPRTRAAADHDRLAQRVQQPAFDACPGLRGGEPADVHPADRDAVDDRVLPAVVVRPRPPTKTTARAATTAMAMT